MAERPSGDRAERASAAHALARTLRELEAQLESGAEAADVDEATIQDAFGGLVKIYAAMLERGKRFPPFPTADGAAAVTATEVAATASAMLQALQIELFELGMWQAWGGLNSKGS
jgi:hypothetical protein